MRGFRQTLRFLLVLLVVFLAPGDLAFSGQGSADAADSAISAKTLMTFCAGKDDVDTGVCNGYIMAVAEAMGSGQTLYGQKACGQDGVKAQQLSDLVRQSVKDDPNLDTRKAGPMVAGILAKSYPCFNSYEPLAGGN